MLDVDYETKAQMPSGLEKKPAIDSGSKFSAVKQAAFDRLPDEIIQQ
jgi:hypothetical protein